MKKFALLALCLSAAPALAAAPKPGAPKPGADDAFTLRCADYQHDADGAWTARHDVMVHLPGGNATIHSDAAFPARGTFMGVQFGYLLDKQCGYAVP